MELVDIDVPTTWPSFVSQQVGEWARRLGGSTSFPSDLDISRIDEESFASALRGCSLRAYHCTRLLEHEKQSIAEDGLQRLTRAFLDRRMARALAAGAIQHELAAALSENNALAKPNGARRVGQVCCLLSSYTLRSDVHALGDLMTLWGGEVISKAVPADFRSRLRGIGKPTLVTVALRLSADTNEHLFYPSLAKAFAAAALGLDVAGDVLFRADVPGVDIERISQPGDAWYDSFPLLPRQ
jgi:hypothetical protein